jgi:hypothetical protein
MIDKDWPIEDRAMRRVLSLVVLVLAGARAAGAAEGPGPLEWHRGDCNVLTWPAAEHTPEERVRQAEASGLTWVVLSNGIVTRPHAAPAIPLERPRLRTARVSPILAVRFHAPHPIGEDLICVGVDPDLPLPGLDVRDIIRWTNAIGGAVILVHPGDDLTRHVSALRGLAAFDAFQNGEWNPACAQGKAWDQLLARGHRLCIVGGMSEGARRVLGREAIATYARARSNADDDIINAIRGGRTVVAERDRIRLNFTVNGAPPGSTVRPDRREVRVAVDLVSQERVDEVKIVGNVRDLDKPPDKEQQRIIALKTLRPNAKQATRAFTLPLEQGTRYLRAVAISYRGTCRTLTSPIFIGREAPEPLPLGVRRKQTELVAVAIDRLDWSRPAQVRTVLERLLSSHRVGPTAAAYLARTVGRHADQLPPLLKSAHTRTRTHAAYVMMKAVGPAALNDLLALLDDRDLESRIYAARALARFAGPEHLPIALKVVNIKDPVLRIYGLAALAHAPSPESLVWLRKALQDTVTRRKGGELVEEQTALSRAAATHLALMLRLDSQRRDRFLDAFRAEEEPSVLGDALLNKAVGRRELRPLVKQIAALDMSKVMLPRPGSKHAFRPVQPGARRFRGITASRTRDAPEIDGRPGDLPWEDALAFGKFVRPDGKLAPHQTSVKVLYDDRALYLLFECEEPEPDKLAVRHTRRDEPVWADDAVEIFLSPVGLRHEKRAVYFHLAVNSKGVRFDEERTRRSWNASWRAATQVGTDRWTVEVAVPFRSLRTRPPQKGETNWLVNFVRRRYVDGPEPSSFVHAEPRALSRYAALRFR